MGFDVLKSLSLDPASSSRETKEMEAFKSETRKRVLPTWMTAQVSGKRAAQVKTPKWRPGTVPAAAATFPALRTAYRMNEAEIVRVALGILIEEDRKPEKRLEPPPLAGADKPERSPGSPAPPSPSPPWSRSEDSEEEDRGADGPASGPAGSDVACSRSLEEDQDELNYVRETFFS